MALFSKKPKEVLDGPGIIGTEDEILGTLDEVFKLKSPLLVRTKDNKWNSSIYGLDAERKVIRIADSSGLLDNNNAPVQCGFSLDRMWYVFQSKLVISSDNKPYILLPKAIKNVDRRKAPRATFSIREKVSVSILESLGRGVGLTGTAVDISSEGLCMVIERAIKLENEQKLNVHSGLLERGTQLMIIKVKGIPGVPTFDTEGIVNRISGPGGWRLAVQFSKIPGSIRSAIDKLVNSRYIQPEPVRRSYQKRMEMQKKREEELAKEPEPKEQPFKDTRRDPKGQVKFVNDDFLSPDNVLSSSPKKDSPTTPPPGKTQQAAAPSSPASPWYSTPIPRPVIKDEPKPAPEKEAAIEHEAEIQPLLEIPQEPQKNVLLSLGDELKESLSFLSSLTDYVWVHVDSPMRIIKAINENKKGFLMLPIEYKGQSTLEYLEKMNSMGILKEISIIIFNTEPVSPRDLIKCRILGIQHIIKYPLESVEKILNIINSNASISQPAASPN